ncbi:MAG: sodium/proline symporter [Planctomycetota bacterium]|jgi:sodium/proline symporter
MTWMLISFFAYMVLILLVGVVAGRRTSGRMESFYLGDRKVGAWVTAISASASSESGWLVLGCVAMGYIYGVAAYWITAGCVLGFAFNWFFFAERIRRRSAENGAITVPELLERVTGDTTKLVRLVGVLIIFVLMFTYVAAQLTAAGVALEAMFSWPYWVGVLIGAAVTIFYTTVGGYRAVSWTDLLQGLLMAAALVALPLVTFLHLGGFDEVEQKVKARPAHTIYVMQGFVGDEYKTVRLEMGRETEVADPQGKRRAMLGVREVEGEEQLYSKIDDVERPLPEADGVTYFDAGVIGLEGELELKKTSKLVGGDAFFSLAGGMLGIILLGWIIEMLGIGLGYPGSPHVIARFMAAKSKREIMRGRFIALSWAVLAEAGAVSMGVLGRALLPDLADPQAGLLEAANYFLPPILVGLIIAAVFAALRSTADSQLLVASSAIVRDLCERVLGMRLDERRAMRLSRIVVLVLGVAAVFLALSENRFIFWFVLFSWAGLGASFAPSLILALYWKRLSAVGVMAGMVTGFAVTLVWNLYVREAVTAAGGPDIYELVPAFFLSLAAAILFSLAIPRRGA